MANGRRFSALLWDFSLWGWKEWEITNNVASSPPTLNLSPLLCL